MSSSQQTSNYLLPIFEADDKPGWLTDWNTAMARIDQILQANHEDIVKLDNRVTALEQGGGGGGTTNFNNLTNRPKYNGQEMTSETDIPDVSTELNSLDDRVTSLENDPGVSDFNDLTNRPKYNGEVMSGDTDIPDLSEEVTNLQSSINTNTSKILTLESAINLETGYRETADNNLQTQIDSLVSKTDVVDIVQTYADLQAYDTSGLGNRDVIEVLNDEEHDGALSYYRWNEPTAGEWNWIGSIAPYYTKSEASGLFVPMTRTINGKPLSENVDIAVPTKVSELENDNNFITILRDYTFSTDEDPFTLTNEDKIYGSLSIPSWPDKITQSNLYLVSIIFNTRNNTTNTEPQIVRLNLRNESLNDTTDANTEYFNVPLPALPPNQFVKINGFMRLRTLRNKFIISLKSNITNTNLKINNTSISMILLSTPF